jgi:hypothetical protein
LRAILARLAHHRCPEVVSHKSMDDLNRGRTRGLEAIRAKRLTRMRLARAALGKAGRPRVARAVHEALHEALVHFGAGGSED